MTPEQKAEQLYPVENRMGSHGRGIVDTNFKERAAYTAGYLAGQERMMEFIKWIGKGRWTYNSLHQWWIKLPTTAASKVYTEKQLFTQFEEETKK